MGSKKRGAAVSAGFYVSSPASCRGWLGNGYKVGKERMPSTNGYSCYLGGEAFLELCKIKGQGGGFAPSKIHIAEHVST